MGIRKNPWEITVPAAGGEILFFFSGKPTGPVIFQWPRITVGDGDRAVSRRFDYSFLEPEIEGLPRPRLVVEKLGISKHRGFPQKGIWNFGLMLHRISRCLTLSISCDCKIFCYADR